MGDARFQSALFAARQLKEVFEIALVPKELV